MLISHSPFTAVTMCFGVKLAMFQAKRSTAKLLLTVSARDDYYNTAAARLCNGNRAGVCLIELFTAVPEMFRPSDEFSHVDLAAPIKSIPRHRPTTIQIRTHPSVNANL